MANEPISGKTDAEGKCILQLEPGTYNFEFTCDFYQSITKTNITVPGTAELKVELDQATGNFNITVTDKTTSKPIKGVVVNATKQ